jgi:hypothetical protein
MENAQDMHTTVMIKNILKYVHHTGADVSNWEPGCKIGYAFVNFFTVDNLLRFARERVTIRMSL